MLNVFFCLPVVCGELVQREGAPARQKVYAQTNGKMRQAALAADFQVDYLSHLSFFTSPAGTARAIVGRSRQNSGVRPAEL